MLLLDDRHVIFEKDNIAFLNSRKVRTDLEDLTPSDVVRLVRPFVGDLYSTDLQSIEKEDDKFVITIRRDCEVYHGTFFIYRN